MSAVSATTEPAKSDAFESAWLKWAMAVMNAKVLEDNIAAFASRGGLMMDATFGTIYHAKSHSISLYVTDFVNPFPVLWGVLLGEVAHDYRCCLDHLAWALYKRGKKPNLSARKERNVYWPIAKTRVEFNNSLDQKLPGVSRADRAIVRRYQPFAPGESRAHRHVFTVLNKLANDDKHRAIQPVVPIPEKMNLTPAETEDCIVRRLAPGRSVTFRPGAEIARYFVKKTGPNPRLGLQPHFSLVAAINELLTLDEFLRRTENATRLVLTEFAPEMPSSAKAMIDAPIPQLDATEGESGERPEFPAE
jgi:hypothetical protein